MKLLQTHRRRIDSVLILSVLALVITGLIFVYSASYYSAHLDYGTRYYFLSKQAVGAVVGFGGMILAIFVKLDIVRRLSLPLLVLSLVLLALVFVPFIGIENYGARRWVGFGGFSFQPSELAKFAFVLFCAYYATGKNVNTSRFLHNMPVIVIGLVYCTLIILEPNMSITVCFALIMAVMLFLGGMRIKHLILCLAPLLVAIPLLIVVEPYRIQRLLAFLDPFASPKEEGYQLIQSLYALGSGGWFGVGLFNSRQKYKFLPFAESDFVFSVIGEEAGLVGCAVVLALFFIVIVRGVAISSRANNRYECLLSAGITAVIAIQCLINIAVVTGSIPPTGLPLPFISYGGTSLVVFMTAIGLLANVSARSQT